MIVNIDAGSIAAVRRVQLAGMARPTRPSPAARRSASALDEPRRAGRRRRSIWTHAGDREQLVAQRQQLVALDGVLDDHQLGAGVADDELGLLGRVRGVDRHRDARRPAGCRRRTAPIRGGSATPGRPCHPVRRRAQPARPRSRAPPRRPPRRSSSASHCRRDSGRRSRRVSRPLAASTCATAFCGSFLRSSRWTIGAWGRRSSSP